MIPGGGESGNTSCTPRGGPARARVVLTLAAVLGLEGADTGTISATTGNLERAFHVGNTDIGLLLSVVSLTGVLFTLPFGVLADRTRRTRLLTISITAWSIATLFSGAAPSYLWLLLARVALGMVTAAAGPVVASLTGDYFPAAERGRMYGLILGGELAGTGLGFVISGDISAALSWRYAMWWLVLPSLALAWLVHKLPEPARGGRGQIAEGAVRIPEESQAEAQSGASPAGDQAGHRPDGADPAEEAVRHAHIQPQASGVGGSRRAEPGPATAHSAVSCASGACCRDASIWWAMERRTLALVTQPWTCWPSDDGTGRPSCP